MGDSGERQLFVPLTSNAKQLVTGARPGSLGSMRDAVQSRFVLGSEASHPEASIAQGKRIRTLAFTVGHVKS